MPIQSDSTDLNFRSHDALKTATLEATGARQVVRLVNTSSSKMKFAFKITPNLSDQYIKVSPRKGAIAPRSYANIVVEDLSYSLKSMVKNCRINLIYWVSDSLKYERGLIKIDYVRDQAEIVRTTKEHSFIWIVLSVIRSSLLLILVFYNIILIKHVIL